ncbi:MAG: FixH family protein [Armatimonadota bacterium]
MPLFFGHALPAATLRSAPAALRGPAAPPSIPFRLVTKRVGAYDVTLRVPADGVFAGEPIDIEYRVSDPSRTDPVLGPLGVVKVAAKAVVTMPEMAGMPEQRPKIHTEGVPGDYGIECFFPHGGGYRIDLTLSVPGETAPLRTFFLVDVLDAEARKGRKPAPPPYRVEVETVGEARAGEPVDLVFRIRETKTKAVVSQFDVAHTKLFHLLMTSTDLAWFAHEHPEASDGGVFRHRRVFPHGGTFRIFADVAPRGAGSQILSTTVRVSGPAPKPVAPTPGDVRNTVDGISARVGGTANPPIGKSVPITFVLTRAEDGRPVTDLEQYLGAYGHLMIIHEDGATVVHSHPAEDEAGLALSRSGTVVFNARFPKPGIYKAWGQFQRAGAVVTIPFVFRVGAAK